MTPIKVYKLITVQRPSGKQAKPYQTKSLTFHFFLLFYFIRFQMSVLKWNSVDNVIIMKWVHIWTMQTEYKYIYIWSMSFLIRSRSFQFNIHIINAFIWIICLSSHRALTVHTFKSWNEINFQLLYIELISHFFFVVMMCDMRWTRHLNAFICAILHARSLFICPNY